MQALAQRPLQIVRIELKLGARDVQDGVGLAVHVFAGKLFLGTEVLVQRRLADPGHRGDIGHPGPSPASGADDLDGGLQSDIAQ